MSTPFLFGKKTLLRPISMSDAPLLARWINNPETRKHLLSRFPVTLLSEQKWIEKVSNPSSPPSDIIMVVETRKEKRPIGTMGLHSINWVDRYAVTGTVIGEKNYRGKGYATDAKIALLTYAFESLGLHKIISHADARNIASIAYSKRCGYVVEGVLKDELFRDGVWVDKIALACFYPALKKALKK